MNQIALALEHYWHLLAQDKTEAEARIHVRARFGVEIDAQSAQESWRHSVLVEREPSTDFGTEFCTTIKGTSTGPAYS